MSGANHDPHSRTEARREFSEAQRLRQLGDLASASQCLARAIAHNPAEPTYHLELAVVFLSDRKYAAAAQEFKRARALGPDDPNCALGCGLAYAELGEPRRASIELEAARATFPRSVRLLTSLGRCYRLQNQRQRALECLQTALEVNPQATAALAEIELARQAAPVEASTEERGNEIHEATPRPPRADVSPRVTEPLKDERRAEYRRQAREAVQAGRYAEAFEALRHALLDGERDDQAVLDLYESAKRARLVEPLRETLGELLRRKPRWAVVHALVGMMLHDQGQCAEAERHYLRARKLNLQAEYLHGSICGLFLDTKRPELAVRIAREGLKKWPRSVDLNYRLGLACFLAGQKKASVQAMQRAVELDPKHSEALYCLAELFMEFGPSAVHTVEKYLLRVLEVNPRDLRAHVNLTIIYLNRRDVQAARHQVEQAKSLGLTDPRLTELRTQLGLSP